MVRLFKGKGISKHQRNLSSGIDHLTGIVSSTNNRKNRNVESKDTQSTASKDSSTDNNGAQFTSIFEDPMLKEEYQLMTTAAKKANFGQCYFARHRASGDVVMIMAIKNEFMNKFKGDLSDASKLKNLMASVDPSLNGLREMIEMSTSTALILDVDMNPSKNDTYDVQIIEDHTTVMGKTTVATESDEPFDDFGSWVQYWVCGAPTNLLICNAARALGPPPPALTAIPEYSDENTNSSNINTHPTGSKHKRTLGNNVQKSRTKTGTDAPSVSILSRVVDVDDATTVALSKRISQHSDKIRSKKNRNKHYKSSVASEITSIGDGTATLPSMYSMDSHSIPPEEDWFSMLDHILATDLKRY